MTTPNPQRQLATPSKPSALPSEIVKSAFTRTVSPPSLGLSSPASDVVKEQILNDSEATALLTRPYSDPYKLA